MQDYDDTLERQELVEDSIKELQQVNKKLAKLTLRKEELVNNIIDGLGHEHEGQKSYEYDMWKVEVRTPFIYSLDKKKYESGDVKLPKEFNPIKESVSYSVDKKLCEDYMQNAPKAVRTALSSLIEKKPGKANVTIKERV